MASLVLYLQSILVVLAAVAVSQTTLPISLPDCADTCGNVSIPYPFGIGPKCYHNTPYEIRCVNSSSNHPKPFLQSNLNLEVVDINWPGRYSFRDLSKSNSDDQTLTVIIHPFSFCSTTGNGLQDDHVHSVDFKGTPYRLSRWSNFLIVENCGGSVVLKDISDAILSGCASSCAKLNSTRRRRNDITNCYGIGCCQASLLPPPTGDYIRKSEAEGLDFYKIAIDHKAVPTKSNNICSLSAALVDTSFVLKSAGRLSSFGSFPTVLEWNATRKRSRRR